MMRYTHPLGAHPTLRQLEAIRLLAAGMSVGEAASALFVERSTVNGHLHRARERTGARTTIELVAMCARARLI